MRDIVGGCTVMIEDAEFTAKWSTAVAPATAALRTIVPSEIRPDTGQGYAACRLRPDRHSDFVVRSLVPTALVPIAVPTSSSPLDRTPTHHDLEVASLVHRTRATAQGTGLHALMGNSFDEDAPFC